MIFKRNCHALLAGLCFAMFPTFLSGGVIYVHSGANGSNSGTSWHNAYTDLQDAIAFAQPGDDIWVARGIYRPHSSDRSASFFLQNNVAIYGGFLGDETAINQRDFAKNPTVLSGDIGIPGNTLDNSYHVVVGSALGSTTTNTAVLDGFTVKHGMANGSGADQSGAGIYIHTGRPSISNCIFENNTSKGNGSGAYMYNSNSVFKGCGFIGNTTIDGDGGGVYCFGQFPKFMSCMFWLNNAESTGFGGSGGGIHVTNCGITLNSCVFRDNTAMRGSAIYASQASFGHPIDYEMFLNNCTVVDNEGKKNGPTSSAVRANNLPGQTIEVDVNSSVFYNNKGKTGSSNTDQISKGGNLTTLEVNYSAVKGYQPGMYNGIGNFGDDPEFLADGYHIDYNTSPCVNKGDPNASPTNNTIDIDGDKRFIRRVDVGADEVSPFKLNMRIGTGHANADEQVTVSPNPSSGIFNMIIHTFDSENIPEVEVFDVQGKSIAIPIFNYWDEGALQLDLSGQPVGVYHLLIRFKDGGSLHRKLMKN